MGHPGIMRLCAWEHGQAHEKAPWGRGQAGQASGSQASRGEATHSLIATHSPQDDGLRVVAQGSSHGLSQAGTACGVSTPLSSSEATAVGQQVGVGVVGGCGHGRVLNVPLL
jgi:hypothetical protein